MRDQGWSPWSGLLGCLLFAGCQQTPAPALFNPPPPPASTAQPGSSSHEAAARTAEQPGGVIQASATTLVEPVPVGAPSAEARSAREFWLGSAISYQRNALSKPPAAPATPSLPVSPARDTVASNRLAPAPTPARIAPRTQVQIRQQIEDLCYGYAREVEVIPEPDNHLLIRIKAFSAATEGQIGNQVRKLPDLKPYQVTLEITTAS